jgi:hypothetical protein
MKYLFLLLINLSIIWTVTSQDNYDIDELLSFMDRTGQFDPNFQLYLKGETCTNQGKYIREHLNPSLNFLINSNVSLAQIRSELNTFLNDLDDAISTNNWELAASILNGGVQALNFANSTKLYSVAKLAKTKYAQEFDQWDEGVDILMESTALKSGLIGNKIVPANTEINQEIKNVLNDIENKTKGGSEALNYMALGLSISTYVFIIACPPVALITGVIGATLGVAGAALDITKNVEQRTALKKLVNNKNDLVDKTIQEIYNTQKMIKSFELQRKFIEGRCGPLTP